MTQSRQQRRRLRKSRNLKWITLTRYIIETILGKNDWDKEIKSFNKKPKTRKGKKKQIK